MALTDQLQEVKIMLHGTAASEGIGIGKDMLIEEPDSNTHLTLTTN